METGSGFGTLKSIDGGGNGGGNNGGGGNGMDIFEPMSAMEELMLQKTRLQVIADEVYSAMHNGGATNGFLKWLHEQLTDAAQGIDATATRLWMVAQAGGDAMLFELFGDVEE